MKYASTRILARLAPPRWRAALLATTVVAACAPDDPADQPPLADEATLTSTITLENGLFVDRARRVRYIVDLHDWAADDHPDDLVVADDLPSYHRPRVRNLIAELGRTYGFRPVGATSWVGASVVAFLTDAQVAELRDDPRVRLVTPDREAAYSAVWTDATTGTGDLRSWGVGAVGGPRVAPTSNQVYVLDAGVGLHRDLLNVERVAPLGANPVGCYAHATHVAGIIGAPQNGLNVAGVDGGARLVSVSVHPASGSTALCGKGGPTTSTIEAGLDWIRARIAQTGRVGIVNLSINSVSGTNNFAMAQSTGAKMRSLATPSAGYPGAFIVQSAGNQYDTACAHAYDTPSTSDGIMVVGALDDAGQPVVPLDGVPGFQNTVAGSETGSNYGACVEAWAPGKRIVSTWADGTTQQRSDTTYANNVALSGTSMAAPMVTGIAAYLRDTLGWTSPAAIELGVRARMVALGSVDPAGRVVSMPTVAGQGASARPSMQWKADGAVATSSTGWSDTAFTLSFDAYGVQQCTVTVYANDAFWYATSGFAHAYSFGARTLGAGTYRHVADCLGTNGQRAQATFTATIQAAPPPVAVQIFVDNIDRSQTTAAIANGTPFQLRYAASGATACSVYAWKRPLSGWQEGWFTAIGQGPTYNWGALNLAGNYLYHLDISCANARNTGSAWVEIRLSALSAMPAGEAGYFEGLGANGTTVRGLGWACAKLVPASVDVLLYVGAPAASGGRLIGKTVANASSEAAVSQACLTSGVAHRWAFTLPAAIRTAYAGQQVYAYAAPPAGYSGPLFELTRFPGARFTVF